jgi:membrane-associated phospholipid phosphatase
MYSQTPLETDSTRPPERRLFTLRDAVVAGGFAGLTVLLFPMDRSVAKELQNESAQANRFFRNASTGVEIVASPGAYIIGGSLYIGGKLTGSRRVADLGIHGTQAVLLADVAVRVIKGTAGRARPYVSSAEDPDNFVFNAGWDDPSYRSFPSGHTATAFAAAAAVTAEVGEWWPRQKVLIGTAMYGGAALVGLSRMYNNRHWGSDVAIGALLGTFSGWKVVQFNHDNPRNRFNRFLIGSIVLPQKDGFLIVWSR